MRHADLIRDFRWEVPETFNFGTDVVDAHARAGLGEALIREDEAGRVERLSFADVARATDRFANVLRAQGIAKGDRIVVVMPRIAAWQIAIVAALKIGAVPIPCIEMLTARDLVYRVRNAGAVGVVCRKGQVPKFDAVASDLGCRIVIGEAPGWVSYDAAIAAASDRLVPAVVRAEDPAIMYYTSGSTGHPKGVLHSARALWTWRMSARHWLDLRPGDRIWCTADTGWSKAGTSILFGPWSEGACAFFHDGPFRPADRPRLLARHRITVYCAPGTELFRVVDEDLSAHDLSALRRTVSAGESMNPVVAERWQRATGIRVDEAYGQTEALMLVLNYPDEPLKVGSMGLPAPGVDIDVIDERGARVGAGVEGQLAIRLPMPQMMLGYWNDPERTAACELEGADGRWFLTGDRGRRDPDGYFWYAGRADDVINSAGYRIGPLEVENVLLEHPAVQECAAVGWPDPERGEIVKAFVVLRPGFAPDPALAAQLQAHVKAQTAPYKYPRAVAFVAELPKTVTGKIRRSALRRPPA